MAKTPKTETTDVTPEVKVVVQETVATPEAVKPNKATLEEMEAGKRALAKHAASK